MRRFYLAWGFSLGLIFALHASEELVDPYKPAPSPEGLKELALLRSHMILAFQDARIEKNYLAAQKLDQLAFEELSRELLDAVVESLHTDNVHYRWHITHLLRRISGEKHGPSLTAWREWLRERYQDAKETLSSQDLGELGSGSHGHDNAGSVDPTTMPPSRQLGHDPGEKIVDSKKREEEKDVKREGAGRMMGPGVSEDLPPSPPKSETTERRSRTVVTNAREDMEHSDKNPSPPENVPEEEETPPEFSDR